MDKIFDFQVKDEKGVKIKHQKNVELAPEACYFYALRLKQRYGMRPVTIKWKEVGTDEWRGLDAN